MRPTAEERDAHMRKIPEKEFEWIKKSFKVKGYIYYKRSGNLVSCFCGACGESYTGITKASPDPYEAVFQTVIKPAHNKPAICKRCGCVTKFKALRRVKDTYIHEESKFLIGQRLGKEEFVFRVFNAEQIMYSDKKTEYEFTEYIRVFLRPGKKPQKDYNVYSHFTGKNTWIDHNLGGFSNIPVPYNIMVSPGAWKEIRNTPMFRYIPLPGEENGIIHYYIAASRYPDFEMIVKSGMIYLTNGLIWGPRTGYRSRGKTHYDRLGIRKERLKDLIAVHGDTDVLRAFQLEKKAAKHWTQEELEIVKHNIQTEESRETEILSQAYKHASPVKVERYIQKHIQSEGNGAFREYIDYLRMRKERGYDLSDEIILFPKDLHRRHNEMVLETEKEKFDKRAKEVTEKYPGIEERYVRLSEKYSAAAGGMIIRPAKNAAEIVTEGRILHHCVGGDFYLAKHNKGESVILFLRKADDRDTPYITVEIKDEKILQWYGKYDRKPDEPRIQAWLNTYTKELAKRKKKQSEKRIKKTA